MSLDSFLCIDKKGHPPSPRHRSTPGDRKCSIERAWHRSNIHTASDYLSTPALKATIQRRDTEDSAGHPLSAHRTLPQNSFTLSIMPPEASTISCTKCASRDSAMGKELRCTATARFPEEQMQRCSKVYLVGKD